MKRAAASPGARVVHHGKSAKSPSRPQKEAANDPNPAGERTPGARWREWLLRFCLIVGAPLFLLGSVEAGLRLFGYGYPVQFFVKSASGQKYITNEKFAWQFSSKKTPSKPFLSSIPLQKPPGTLRVCVLGESAAMGTPDPAFGFGRILVVLWGCHRSTVSARHAS